MPGDWLEYAWLDDEPVDDDLMSGCLGVVTGLDEAEVLRRLGIEAAPVRVATVHEAWRLSESEFGNDLAQVATLGNAVVTFEPNGWHGVDGGLATELSRRGRYAAYFWNVNAMMRFVFAEAGVIRRDFDPLFYDAERDGAVPEELDLPFPSTPRQASLALIERLTDVRITRAWLLDEARPTYRIDPESRDASR